MRISLPLLAALAVALPASAAEKTLPKQLVIISFDGAHDNALWTRSLAMAKRANAKFTYFLSCTYLIEPDKRKFYKAPHQKAGKSETGFAVTREEIPTRLRNIWEAYLGGHEIGSHVCGHFNGKSWSTADWEEEFGTFDRIVLNAWKENGIAGEEPKGWKNFVTQHIRGFRAPYLAYGDSLAPALKAHGFEYDASLVSKGPALPIEDNGILRFALPLIPEGPQGRPVLGMDYNLLIRHSGGFNSPERATKFQARTLEAFRNAFKAQYEGDRTPLQLGFHFTEMNGGAYWNALETFLTETCGKPDVACVNYQQAITMLEVHSKTGVLSSN